MNMRDAAANPDREFDHIETRELLRNLLNINPGAYPVNLVGDVVREIDKIAFGETSPAFQRQKQQQAHLYSVSTWAAVMDLPIAVNGRAWEERHMFLTMC